MVWPGLTLLKSGLNIFKRIWSPIYFDSPILTKIIKITPPLGLIFTPVDGKVKWCVEDLQELHGWEDTEIPDLEVSSVGVVTFELGSDCDCFVDAEVV